MKKRFGLIGRNISYSFSQKYFSEKFSRLGLDYSYSLFDIADISDVLTVFKTENLAGLNVTIPYKQSMIPFLDDLSDEAREIGAVNTIAFNKGFTKGFNTDLYGFAATLDKAAGRSMKSALILGDGGAAKAVKYVLEKRNIISKTVARKNDLNFEKLDEEAVRSVDLIVQCTPIGTFPETEMHLPFPFEGLNKRHTVIDLIYNPVQTAFLRKAAAQGALILNGQLMLEQQAEKAWEIWTEEC